MIGQVTSIRNESMDLEMYDPYEERHYKTSYLLEIMDEQRDYVIEGDIVEFVTHPETMGTLGRIRRRSVPNRFFNIYMQTQPPEQPDIEDDEAVRDWNDYVYIQRAAVDRFREILKNSGVNWLKEGF